MSVVDILIAIIVVTILVTIVLGVVTYLAYKLRLARKPAGRITGSPQTRYFVLQEPPAPASPPTQEAPSADSLGDVTSEPTARHSAPEPEEAYAS
jgi:hypothetical protein